MKVQLAYPYPFPEGGKHKPDDVVDLDDTEAARYLAEGLARIPDKQTGEDRSAPKPGSVLAEGLPTQVDGPQPATVTTTSPRGVRKGGAS